MWVPPGLKCFASLPCSLKIFFGVGFSKPSGSVLGMFVLILMHFHPKSNNSNDTWIFKTFEKSCWNDDWMERVKQERLIIRGGGGGSQIDKVYVYTICACLLGCYFTKFNTAIGGLSSEMKEPKLHKLSVFWANFGKKHPTWPKLDAFLSKMVYRWVGNCAKNWYRESQIFEVR